MKRILVAILLLISCEMMVWPQALSLEDAIQTARRGSVSALEARQAFISTYWAWRSYKASRLPSVYVYGNLGNYNRSLTLLQNPQDGSMTYTSTHNLQNGIGLRAVQNIPWTGGTLYVYTDLNRIDQFGAVRGLTWYSQPITLSYQQPLFSYNSFKWDSRIAPKEYEQGKRQYLEAMEKVTMKTIEVYFGLLLSQQRLEMARRGYADSENLCAAARERMKLGTVTRDEYLQLELRMLSDSLSINDRMVKVREAQMALNSHLGLNEQSEAVPVLDDSIPALTLEYSDVLELALLNSKFSLDQEIQLLQAQSSVEKAKAEKGITMSFNARFGLSNTAPSLAGVYKDPLDQEVFGLSFSVPILDWGLGKGKVEKARAAQEVARAQVTQAESDFRREIFTAVGQFNNQKSQCDISRRASQIAQERYSLVMERFRRGETTVLELNNARQEKDNAQEQYVKDLQTYWASYYGLRRKTLFDFIQGMELELKEDELLDVR